MGNVNQQSKFFQETFEKDFIEQGKIRTEFGEFQICRSKMDSRLVAKRSYQARSNEEHEYLMKSHAKRITVNHPNLIKLHFYSSILKGHSCTSFNKIESIIEWQSKTLDQEIESRILSNSYLPEADLWVLLNQICQACRVLKGLRLNAEDIRPSTIFIQDSQSQEAVLADRTVLLGYQGSYMMAFKSNGKVLLAPEQIQALKKDERFPDYDLEKCDVFQTGMTILLTANLYKCEYIYDFPRYAINQSKYDEGLQKIINIYSLGLMQVIQWMTRNNPNERPTFDQIDEFIRPFMENFLRGVVVDVLKPVGGVYSLSPTKSMTYSAQVQNFTSSQIVNSHILGSAAQTYTLVNSPVNEQPSSYYNQILYKGQSNYLSPQTYSPQRHYY